MSLRYKIHQEKIQKVIKYCVGIFPDLLFSHLPLPSFPTDNIHLQHDQMGDVRPTPPRSKPPNEISDSEADEFSFEGGDVDISNDPFVRSHSILQVGILYTFSRYIFIIIKYSQCLINSRKQIARLACGASHRLFEKRTLSISRFFVLCLIEK